MGDRIEEFLYKEKIKLEELKAPEEFESSLRSALKTRKKKRFNLAAAVAVLIAVLVLTYSSDAIAYYGRKLLGYDEVVSGSIKQLNEEGMGQEINKSHTFSDGTEITLNGIMFDDKELVAFYKIENKNKDLGNESISLKLKGLAPMKYSMSNGQGKSIDEHTRVWTMTFEPPAFFEKWMSFDVEYPVNGKYENGSIRFTLNRSKAMKHIVKWNIDREIVIGDVKVAFDTITASRLSTVVEGSLETENDSLKQSLGGEIGYQRLAVEFDLTANGKKLQLDSCSFSDSGNKIDFSSISDGLPADINLLEISNIHLVDWRMVDKNTDLTLQTHNLKLADDLVVKTVYHEGENTCVNIESKGRPVMGLFIDGKQADNIEPLYPADNKSSADTIDKVYKFKGRGENMTLSVKTIEYAEYSDESIKIPVE